MWRCNSAFIDNDMRNLQKMNLQGFDFSQERESLAGTALPNQVTMGSICGHIKSWMKSY